MNASEYLNGLNLLKSLHLKGLNHGKIARVIASYRTDNTSYAGEFVARLGTMLNS